MVPMSHWQLKPGLWGFGEIDFLLLLNSLSYEVSNPKVIVRYIHGKCIESRLEYRYVSIEFWTKKVELNISTLETLHDTYIVYFKAT